jgi:predicted XRE-type DNA-binding protein
MQRLDYELGSDNLFEDLGLPNPAERSLKADLAIKIRDFISAQGWTQTQAASVLGCTQAEVSDLTRGRITRFSLERLLRYVQRLGHRVTLTIEAPSEEPAGESDGTRTPTVEPLVSANAASVVLSKQ